MYRRLQWGIRARTSTTGTDVTIRYDASNYTTFAVAAAGDLSITCTGTDPDRFGVVLGSTESLAVDDATGATSTRLWLYDGGTSAMQRVKVGANGTGPAGNERALYMDEIPA